MWIFVFTLLIIGAFSIVVWSVRNGISPMPTSPKVKKALFASLPPHLQGTFLELGSGWGTLAFPLAKKYPDCAVLAYETSPVPYVWSKLRHLISPLPNLKIYRRDFRTVSFHDATLLVCYLYPAAMGHLKTKMERELCPGSSVVSHTFALPGWSPEKVVTVNDLYQTKIYLYTL